MRALIATLGRVREDQNSKAPSCTTNQYGHELIELHHRFIDIGTAGPRFEPFVKNLMWTWSESISDKIEAELTGSPE